MADFRLTYCGNVHAAPSLAAHLSALREHAAPVAAAARAAQRSFGLGSWWPAQLAHELAHEADSARTLLAALQALDLPLWTLNAFPMGGFHDAVVKTSVYAPDWTTEDRLHYTRLCADAAALLGCRGTLPISTLPLGYRVGPVRDDELRVMARNLARCASGMAAVEQRTGLRCVIALEPEPHCILETAAQAADFLEKWVFDEGAWTVPEAILRRHLGVCVDLCHLFVVGEKPLPALVNLQQRGIAVPKIQVSSCLEVRDAAGLDDLFAFAEPRYLHQTRSDGGARALDLDEVRARRMEFAASGRVRSHYHVPVYWDQEGAFGSTRTALSQVLRGLAGLGAELPLLEVETYTWGVLGDFAGTDPLAVRIARELEWVAQQLSL